MQTPDYLANWITPGQRQTTGPFRRALDRMGHPERAVPTILVGGTNGKGSTVAFLETIFRAAGYRTGTFTSPALSHFNEQIRLQGRPITARDSEAWAKKIKQAAREPLTLFESAAAMAFLSFAHERPDIAIVEVGMGGRHDATNVCEPILSILTSVSMDHVQELGGSVASITLEKAAIGRPGRPLITGADGAARRLLCPEITNRASPLDVLDEDFHLQGADDNLVFTNREIRIEGLRIGLLGVHQRHNAALAVQATSRLNHMGFAISPEAVREGLRAAAVRGRLEWFVHPEGYRFLVDGGHNPDAASALARTLKTHWQSGPRWVAIAIYSDKDIKGFLEALLPGTDRILCTRSSAPRCVPPEALARLAHEVAQEVIPPGAEKPQIRTMPTIADAVSEFGYNPAGVNLLCGSLSVVQEAEQAVERTLPKTRLL